MPIITRSDGVNFAVYTYRELLAAKKPALLKREIELLREENGNFARFFEQANGDIEAVFSKEEGYLLGEIVWDYLDRPDDLIFCEALPNGEDAILVVVRGSSIYLDTVVPVTSLVDDFISLVSGASHYDIYVYGDVPLAETASDEKFAFAPNNVRSFTQLPEPVFPQLRTDEDLKLLPIDDAVNELQLAGSSVFPYMTIIIVFAIGGFAIWKFMQPAPVVVPVEVVTARPVDPYQEYKQALMTPSPRKQLTMLVNDIRQLYTLPGWTPLDLNYKGATITTKLASEGGGVDILLAWVRTNKAQLTVNAGQAELTIPLSIPNRKPPTTLYDLKDTMSRLYDQLNFVLPGANVTIGNTIPANNYSTTELTVDFAGITLDVLLLLADELAGLPVILNNCTLTLNDGLLSGTLTLMILGKGQQ